jgi:hypothetical protein
MLFKVSIDLVQLVILEYYDSEKNYFVYGWHL